MKIAFFDDATEFGGHELMAVAAAAGVAQHPDFVVRFYVWQGNQRLIEALQHECRLGASIEIETMVLHARKAQGVRTLFFHDGVSHVADLFNGWNPALVVAVQGRIELGSVAHQAAKKLGIASLSYLPMAHTHLEMRTADAFGFKDWIAGQLYQLPGGYITISPAIVDQIKRFVPDKPCSVVENFVELDLQPLSKAEARIRLGWSADKKIVGMIGRVQFAQKGHDRVVRALKRQPAILENAEVIVVGDGPDLERLKALVQEAGFASQFNFLGWRNGDLSVIYRAMDLLLVSSLFESGPLVLLEAIGYGTAVVSSDRVGFIDWIPHEDRFDPESESQLLQVLSQALDKYPASPDHAEQTSSRKKISTKKMFGSKFCEVLEAYSAASLNMPLRARLNDR